MKGRGRVDGRRGGGRRPKRGGRISGGGVLAREYLSALHVLGGYGFYFRNGNKEELLLGPYVGAPTDHTVIPFGKGICGQVAVSNQNFVVPDVAAQDNYIACSFTVKSEIVVPLFMNGENIGQIDIDSNFLDPFTEADERFLEFVNSKIAKLF